MIDTSKPLQLSDGTPVELCRAQPNGPLVVRVPESHRLRGLRGFNADGSRPSWVVRASDLRLSNVPVPVSFDPTKPVQTRDGRPARIIATDRKSTVSACLVALVSRKDGVEEDIIRFKADGSEAYGRDGTDLVNVPETTERVFAIYPPTDVQKGDKVSCTEWTGSPIAAHPGPRSSPMVKVVFDENGIATSAELVV